MQPAGDQETSTESSCAPRAGVRLMIVIIVALALLAIYANVQKARREKIEQVTIIPVTSTPPASPSPGE